jgi:hypothetical protein
MPIPEVQFVSEQDGEPCHKYLLDGKEIPGLSYILEFSGFLRYGKVSKDVMEAARERGAAADEACNFFNQDFPAIKNFSGDLRPWEASALAEPLDDWTRSRLQGWIKFRQDFKFDVLFVQKRMAHEMNGMLYGFTLDCFGKMGGKMGGKDAIVEVKATAESEPSHAIQTAAQSLPFKDEQGPERWGIYLRDNDYRPEQFKDRCDERIFGAILAATWWKWNRGIR